MTHPRETIRKNAATSLTGLTETGSNVFESRIYPVESGNLPALSVYMQDEELAEERKMGDEEIVAELRIEVRATANDSLDDLMDDILEDVQAAIQADKRLSGSLSRNARYAGLEGPTFSALESEQDLAIAVITYHVTYEHNV